MIRRRGPALDLTPKVLDRLKAQPAQVWTPIDFLDLGPRAAIDKALQRLARAKTIARLDRGLYYLPRPSALTGRQAVPNHGAVIDAVARRDQSRVVIDGLTAANDLGLTTAVPSRVTLLTDSRHHPIQLGNQRIQFQTVAPSRLYWAGHPSMRFVQALRWSKDLLDSDRPKILHRLKSILYDSGHGKVLQDDLKEGLHTLPVWMQSVIRELLESDSPHGQTRSRRPAPRSRRPVGKVRRRATRSS